MATILCNCGHFNHGNMAWCGCAWVIGVRAKLDGWYSPEFIRSPQGISMQGMVAAVLLLQLLLLYGLWMLGCQKVHCNPIFPHPVCLGSSLLWDCRWTWHRWQTGGILFLANWSCVFICFLPTIGGSHPHPFLAEHWWSMVHLVLLMGVRVCVPVWS